MAEATATPTARPGPTAEQRAAIESSSLDILVEAGAGSGKTTTTVDRYMRRLEELGGDPRRLLVFTFTDKAATELRSRVRERLALRQAELPAAGSSASMSSAWVGTFHSICRRILAAHPIAAGVDPSFAVLDDVEAITLKREAFTEALGRATDRDPGLAGTVGVYGEWSVRNTVISIHDELRSRGRRHPRLPARPEVDLDATLARLEREAGEALSLERLARPQRECLEAILALLRQEAPLSGPEAIEPYSFGSKKEDLAACVEAIEAAVSDLAASSTGAEVYARFGALLAAYDESFARAKAERNGLDYEDLQLATLDLLESSPGIRAHYREQFREIMVDEFQDTNQLQVDLVAALRGEGTSLFTVGDELQSIYGFRHADISLFRSRRETHAVEVLPMTSNFRSQPGVIAAVNEIGVRLHEQVAALGTQPDEHVRHVFTPLVVGAEPDSGPAPPVELMITDREGWEQLDLGPLSPPERLDVGGPGDSGRHEAEALALAHRIRQLVEGGEVAQGQVAILTRTKKRFDIYRRALEQVGLDPYVVGGAGFWETREGIDLRSLLSVVANPLDDDHLLGALASPACGLSTDALWLLRAASGRGGHLWPALRRLAGGEAELDRPEWLEHASRTDRERAAAFVEALDGVRSEAPRISLERLVERTVTVTGYDLASLAADRSGTGMANLRRVMSLAREFEGRSGRDLRSFLTWTEVSAELNDEASVATHEEDSDVVRLMTIHKAKGLEFDLVCLPELARRPILGREDARLRIGPPAGGGDELDVGLRLVRIGADRIDLFGWKRLAEAQKAEDLDEELRLLHVGMTRARKRLILSGVGPKGSPSTSQTASMLDRIVTAFGVDLERPEPVELDPPATRPGLEGEVGPARIEVRRIAATEEDAAILRGSAEAAERDQPAGGGSPPLWRPEERPELVKHLSYSEMSRDEREPAPEEAEAPPPVRDHGTEFGNAIHRLLERSALRRWRHPAEEEILEELERQMGEGADAALPRARAMVSGWLGSKLARRLEGARLRAEVPFLLEVPSARGPRTVRGAIDLLATWDDGSPPLVLDYKTNRLDGGEPEAAMPPYELQRRIYALAVHEALAAEEVETAYCFLERPDAPVMMRLGPMDLEMAAIEIGEAASLALDPASLAGRLGAHQ